VFGDVGQPEFVGAGSSELSLDQVIVHRRTRPTRQTTLARMHRPEPLLGAEPVDPLAASEDAGFGELVGDERVAELRVVGVDVDRGVEQVRVGSVPIGHRLRFPCVEGLLGKAEHPAVTATGILSIGSSASSRTSGNIISGRVAGEVGRRSTQDLDLLLELLVASTQLADLDLIGGLRRCKLVAVLAVGGAKPTGQDTTRRSRTLELPALETDRHDGRPRDDIPAELLRIRSSHGADPSSDNLVIAGKESTETWSDRFDLTTVIAARRPAVNAPRCLGLNVARDRPTREQLTESMRSVGLVRSLVMRGSFAPATTSPSWDYVEVERAGCRRVQRRPTFRGTDEMHRGSRRRQSRSCPNLHREP
jgi:hypothetical protein